MNTVALKELKIGGPVDTFNHLYIERNVDQELLENLRKSEYVNIVTSRQMGKTSLVFKAMDILQEEGVLCAYFDLSAIRGEKEARLYFQSITKELSRELKLDLNNDTFWEERINISASQAWIDFFSFALKSSNFPIVICLDEIETTISRDFTDDLFAALRTMYTRRPRNHEFKRLTFCLVGVANPNELIKEKRTTPYNIGHTIWVYGFNKEIDDLSKLLSILNENSEIADLLLERIFYWTAGQPYLTALLCNSIGKLKLQNKSEVDNYIEETFLSIEVAKENTHFEAILRFINHRFNDSAGTLQILKNILKGKTINDKNNDIRLIHLKLSGLIKRGVNNELEISNRLYQKLFDKEWVDQIENTSTKTIKEKASRVKFFTATTVIIGLLTIFISFFDLSIISTFLKNPAPIAKLTCDKEFVEVGETITCKSSSSQYENLEWNFGNNTNAFNEEVATINYDEPGNYLISLEASPLSKRSKSAKTIVKVTVKEPVKITPPIHLNLYALSQSETQQKKQIIKIEQRREPSGKLFGTNSRKKYSRQIKAESGYLISSAKVTTKTSRLSGLLGPVEISEDKKIAEINYAVGRGSITDGTSGKFLANLELTLTPEVKTNKKLVGKLSIDTLKEYLIDTIIWDSFDELLIESQQGQFIGKSSGEDKFKLEGKNLNLQIFKINNNKTTIFVSQEQAFKESYTYRKKGLFNVTNNWNDNWFNYLTIYKDFVQLQTNKGFNILNSPDNTDIFEKKNEGFIEVAGYIRTDNGVFYITKFSYENRDKSGYPKFISPLQ